MPADATNVRQAVPFFMVADMAASLRFYVDALKFKMTDQWTPNGNLRWCWLELGGAAIMLQERWMDGERTGPPATPVGEGVSVCFQCKDALAVYHDAKERGLSPREPFVGNRLWVVSFTDPDGYRLDFESPTEAPEEITLTQWTARQG